MPHRRSADLIAGVILAAIPFALYHKAARLWWCWDDAYNIHQVITRPAAGFLMSRDAWPQRLFTPLLMETHEALLQLFALNATNWYLFNICLLAGASVAIYATLRLVATPALAFCGAALFVAGPPVCSLALQLMSLHYAESILLGALAIIGFVVAIRRRSLGYAVASGAAYFLAILAKEIAAPLPLVLLLLREGSWRERVRALLPHTAVVILYVLWRWSVLGVIFGGYGWALGWPEIPAVVLELPVKLLRTSAGSLEYIGFAAIVLLAGIIAVGLRRAELAVAGVALVCAIVPIIPVAKEVQPRYAVALWVVLAATSAIAATRMRYGVIAMSAALALTVVANRQEWAKEYALADRMSAEARSFVDLPPDGMLRKPAIPPAAMGELRWLKEAELGRPGGALWFYDDIFLCHLDPAGRRIVEYRAGSVVPVADARQRAHAYCSAIRTRAPLWAKFRHEEEILTWTFGPYDQGEYAVTIANGVQSFVVPRRESFRMHGIPELSLKVRYTAPEGWVTYSDEIHLDLKKRAETSWAR